MKKHLSVFILLALGSGLLTGCSLDTAPKQPVTPKEIYDITFVNYDETVVESVKVEEGTVPSCSKTPTKPSDKTYNYTFKGWSPELYPADKNQTYTATYSQEAIPVTKYTITFKNYDGSILETKQVEQGVTPSCSITPTKPSDANYDYTFKGWNPSLYAANKNQVYTPTFTSKEKTIPSNNYVKVTSTPDEWEGNYLIVYESKEYCFNGSLSTLDASNNYKSVTIDNGVIEGNNIVDKYAFTVSSMSGGYSILSYNGYYIGCTSGRSGLTTSSSPIANTLSYTSGKSVVTSNGKTLSFNTQDSRFRYYTSSQQAIALYKQEGSSTPVELEGLSLSETSGEIVQGKSVNLTVSYIPSNVSSSRKGVTWTSSDTSVATVSEGKVTVPKTATVGATATISAVSRYDTTIKATYTLKVLEATQSNDGWTIMIYMCGADLESDRSQGGAATADLKEIKSVANQPEDVNIIVQTGGASSWKTGALSGISAEKSQRWHLENNQFVQDSSKSKVNMGLSSSLQSFLEWGFTEYPAENVGVIFWNHGGGMYGVCYDEQYDDDSLTNDEVKLAFNNAFTTVGRTDKIEFIGYDACLMNVQDIAEFNSEYAKYMIASEESEIGTGWAYDYWLQDLYNKEDTVTICESIADSFISVADDIYAQYREQSDQTLSVLDLQYMGEYKTAWEDMAKALMTMFASNTSLKSTFKSAVNKAKRYAVDDENSDDYFATYDAKDFLTKIKGNSSINPGDTYIDACLTAFNKVVIHNAIGKGAGNSNGMACFFAASSGYDGAYNALDYIYTSKMTNFTYWRNFNNTYGG